MYKLYKASTVIVGRGKSKQEVLIAVGKPIVQTRNLRYLSMKLDLLNCDTILRYE